jgi:hypothetical protein
MQSLCCRRAWLLLLAYLSCGATAADAQLWRQFLPSGSGKTNDTRTALRSAAAGADFGLTQEKGPWLIVAASFSGEGAEEQARSLAQELRTRYRLAAYVHEMSFNLGEESPGRGLDEYGAPVRRRFRRGHEIHELAVLVGDFPSVEDPEAQQALERIKTLQPDALNVEAGETAQSMAQVRRFEDALLEKLGKRRKRGPMAQAFLTRNPLLPREYFVPKGVDPFVAKMNEGVEHGLLDCAGQYTVRVATFRGKTILQAGAKEDQSAKSFWNRRKIADDNPLVEAAENAHLLTAELRAHGWEAYEFHDRTESIVTIGSFAQAAQRLPDGRVIAVPEVERIFRTFGAAYETQADPLTHIGNDEITQRRVDQEEQQFNLRISSQQGQIVPGLNPKHVKIFHGRGNQRELERIIPMDPTPQAIEAPKRSISSAYAG